MGENLDFVDVLKSFTSKAIAQNETLQQITAKIAEMETAALLRQIAINVEYEKKLKCWELMTVEKQKKYLNRKNGLIDESTAKSTSLVTFENDVPAEKWDEYLRFYDATDFYSSLPMYDRTTVISDALLLLKKGNLTFAHPSEVQGSPVTYDDCVKLVQDSTSLAANHKTELVIQLDQLKMIRKNKRETDFLYA